MKKIDFLKVHQKYCNYKITSAIQALDFDVDIERLRKEIFDFIVRNQFGFSVVSLRLPKGETDWTTDYEMLESNAVNDFTYHPASVVSPKNKKHALTYNNWHPDLENSYVAELTKQIEKLSGLKITRIRLSWLKPTGGYPMHADVDPMRIHIPIFTNTLAYFVQGHKIYHMQYGKLYHLVTTSNHTAWNFGKLPRLHLIFSTYHEEIDKIVDGMIDRTTTRINFVDHIIHSGVDEYSLEQLCNLSLPHVESEEKRSQVIHDTEQLIQMLQWYDNLDPTEKNNSEKT